MTRVSEIDCDFIVFEKLANETRSLIEKLGYRIDLSKRGKRVISIHNSGKTDYEIIKDLVQLGIPFESHYKNTTGYAVQLILEKNNDNSDFLTCAYDGKVWISNKYNSK